MPRTTYDTQREEAKRIGERVRWAREAVGITPTELGADVGVDSSAIRHVGNGNRLPSIHMLMALCHVLRVSPQYLLWGNLEGVDPELAATLKRAHPELPWPAARQTHTHTDNPTPNTVRRPKTRHRSLGATLG